MRKYFSVIALLIMSQAGTASALVRYDYLGVVDEIFGNDGTFGITRGSRVRGNVTFFTALGEGGPDPFIASQSPTQTYYSDMVADFNMQIGNLSLSFVHNAFGGFITNDDSTYGDRFRVNEIRTTSDNPMARAQGIMLDFFSGNNTISNTSLSNLMALRDFSFLNFQVWDDNYNPPTLPTFTGHFDEFSVAPIPEPATIVLTGAGIIGLALSGKKRNSASRG